MTRLRHCLAVLFLVGAGACAARREAPAPESPTAAPAPGGVEPETQTPGGGPPGYAPPPPASPSPSPQPGPPPSSGELGSKSKDDTYSSPDEAVDDLEKAKAELDGLYQAQAEKKGTTQPAKPRKPGTTPLAEADSRCQSACKAFASLKRAADGVCRLTKEDDTRCVRARKIVEENRARVEACKCKVNGGS